VSFSDYGTERVCISEQALTTSSAFTQCECWPGKCNDWDNLEASCHVNMWQIDNSHCYCVLGDGYLLNGDKQVEEVFKQLANDLELKDRYNALGFSLASCSGSSVLRYPSVMGGSAVETYYL
jgi:hypothetical protein